MRIDILTLFPSLFGSVFSQSIIKKAAERKIIKIDITDIRKFGIGEHRIVDDRQYGGGAGMILMAPPVASAIERVCAKADSKLNRKTRGKRRIILLSPQGKVLTQKKARELSGYRHLILVCGHYGGVDERLSNFVDEEISIGDYVLTGGEIPAMVLVDAVVRLLPGVVGNSDSVECDSHWEKHLASPVYTRPFEFRGLKVPGVLLSGDHEKIEKWRRTGSRKNTETKRPDLLYKKT